MLCGKPPEPSPQWRRRQNRAIQSPDPARSRQNRSCSAADTRTHGTLRGAPASPGCARPPTPTASTLRSPPAIRGRRLPAYPLRAERNNREPDTGWQPIGPIDTHGRSPETATGGSGDEPSAMIRSARPSQTVRRLRPLARRRFSTARPAFVDMRTRNPCVFLRLRLFGWYVRFTAPLFSPTHERASGPRFPQRAWEYTRIQQAPSNAPGNTTPTAIDRLTEQPPLPAATSNRVPAPAPVDNQYDWSGRANCPVEARLLKDHPGSAHLGDENSPAESMLPTAYILQTSTQTKPREGCSHSPRGRPPARLVRSCRVSFQRFMKCRNPHNPQQRRARGLLHSTIGTRSPQLCSVLLIIGRSARKHAVIT